MPSVFWLPAGPWACARHLARSLLLPVLLLLAQQSLLLHELRHVAPAERTEGSVKKEAAGLCKLCLALAQVESAARPDATPALLLSGLSFGWVRQTAGSACSAARPALHNRGPPALA